ncbi:MAG TPA: hydantoinase B/oxoprolinase family protein [Thermomicrobiaceae bacterium]|nr:hydantoinase B/oxoprolinase family protein [Thermomicrobiaceae bacterium]
MASQTDTTPVGTDRVLLEVLRNRFQAIADEMGYVVLRTGHTVFVKETGDFGVALVSRQGEVFATPYRVGVHLMVGKPMRDAIRYVEEHLGGWHEGDVFLSNDPVTTGGMATHLPDVYIWQPVFHEGEVLCFAWSFIHFSDVGGRVPGSIAPSNSETFQEGIIFPPVHLVSKGELNQEVRAIFLANCRIPALNWGDIKAQLAGLATAERRVHDLVGRYGVDAVRRGIADVLDYSEAQARRVIASIPDGTYRFTDYLETDHVLPGRLQRIQLALTVDGGDLTLDFTGSDPQVQAAFNVATNGQHGHWMIAFGLVSVLRTLEPDMVLNSGAVRPMRYVLPRGSILNPEPGAAYGVRAALMFRVFDLVIATLGQALPDRINAAGSSQGSILLVSVPDPATGATRVSVVQPLAGGSGGRPMKDGLDGVDVCMGYLRNVPTESVEQEMPVLIPRYSLREDSGGPGYYRGGVGVVLELKVFPPNGVVTARGMERYRFRPWGRLGGRAGTLGYTTLNPGTDGEADIGKIDVLHLEPGDVLRIGTQGGGGYGDPLARPAERVLADVLDGLVGVASARDGYGVVLADGRIDEAATERLRAELRVARGDGPLPAFDLGPEREAYERVWTPEIQDAINAVTAGYRTRLRQFLRGRLFERLDARLAAGEAFGAADVAPLLAEIEERELTVGRR